MKIKSLLLFAAICCVFSCKSGNKQAELGETDNATMASVIDDIDELESNGTIALDKEAVSYLFAEHASPIGAESYDEYKLAKLFPKPNTNEQMVILAEYGFSFLNEGVEVLLIAQQDDAWRAWLVSYENKKLVSSYLVFVDGEKLEFVENHKVYTILSSDGSFIVHDNDVVFFDEKETPVKIHTNGQFEAYPDEEYNNQKYGFGWGSEAIYGKYPLQKDWTIIDLKSKKATNAKAVQHGTDELNGVITFFDKQFGEYSNLAFQGVISPGEIAFIHPDSIANNSIKHLVEAAYSKLNLEDDIDRTYTVSALYQVNVHKQAYYLAVCSADYSTEDYEDVKDFLVGVFNNNVYKLTNTCFYNSYDALSVFLVKDEMYLYTYNTSCGEGAAMEQYLYKLNSGFNEVLSLFTYGD